MNAAQQQATAPSRGQSRRAVVKGAAWAVPVLAMGAPAAHAGISRCTVSGSIQMGPNVFTDVDAVCRANAQSPDLGVPRIRTGYGRAWLPVYIEICNCTVDSAWYRFREVDTLDNFQIEVAGRHNDQNGSGAGFRPAFKLSPVGESGGCQRFPLTYRTSQSRPYSSSLSGIPGNAVGVTMTVTLQRNASTSGSAPSQGDPSWTTVSTFTVSGSVWRTVRAGTSGSADPVDFGSCAVRSGAAAAVVQTESRVAGLD